jgi:hypothetical protein
VEEDSLGAPGASSLPPPPHADRATAAAARQATRTDTRERIELGATGMDFSGRTRSAHLGARPVVQG